MATTYYKNTYSLKQWREMLCKRFDKGNPVVLCGSSNTTNGMAGHSFVGDGYDSNGNIHINWGWSGKGDGYYSFYKFGTDKYDFFDDMSFTEFSKDESGDAASKIEQPRYSVCDSHIYDNGGNTVSNNNVEMDADKFDASLYINILIASWEGKIKLALYDKDGKVMLGNVSEAQELTRTNSSYTTANTFRVKADDFADLNDGHYQIVVLLNNTNDDNNWIKADNKNTFWLTKSNGRISLTQTSRFTGHLTQTSELKFDRDTYDLSDIAQISISVANNSQDDFSDMLYAKFRNVDTNEELALQKTGLSFRLFAGDTEVTYKVGMPITPKYGLKSGKYEVTLWQYCNDELVAIENSKPTVITINENPKKQPKLLVKSITLSTDEDIDVKPGDILYADPDMANVSFSLGWDEAEVEPEYFGVSINYLANKDGKDLPFDTMSAINLIYYKSIFDEEKNRDINVAFTSDNDLGSTYKLSVVYNLTSVNGKYAYAKYIGTDKDATFTVNWTDDPTDIRNLNSTCLHVVGRWNAQGIKLSGEEKGLNIVRYSDGSMRKVVVK